ncbi:2,3-butanediol dehydrogenase, R-alcohol forming, (R)- and (S)-acetoin-specific (EC [Olavius sp. associated proteobacterium Delta 1]|nr:2,3-butanediol dehydrogenase, R-alcohol forming, (R)- and (S)-acetoin-specific (EC [Olavius sp. associated proteobacterium Delta 1]
MKALVLEEYNKLIYKDVPEPQVGPDDVLVQIKASGICGSDVHGMDGSTGRRIPPLVMGHEAAGIVTEVGSNTKKTHPGQRVTFDSTLYCGTCFFCRRGDINLCDQRRVLGVSCDEYRQHGTFAEYAAVPQHIIYPLPEKINYEQSAMVEPCSVAFHAVAITPLALNDTAVVVGAGIIGLLVIQTLRTSGCGQIIAVDLESQRLELARQLGADVALNPAGDDVASMIKKMTAKRGADLAFDAVGINASLKTALNSLRKGGALTLIGNLKPEVDLALQTVVTGEINVRGSCASRGDYPACLDMIARGAINVDALISATAPLSEGAQWFERLYQKEKGLIKVILTP